MVENTLWSKRSMKLIAYSDDLPFIGNHTELFLHMQCFIIKIVKIEKADLDAGTPLWPTAAVLVHQQHETVHSLGNLLLQQLNKIDKQ